MPAVTPPQLTRSPWFDNACVNHLGPRPAELLEREPVVVEGRPRDRPAAETSIAPVHTDASVAPAS